MEPARHTGLSSAAMVVGKDLLLDLIEATRGDLDAVDTLIWVSIVQANLGPVMARSDLESAYAVQPPPDELRRPISVAALAGATGLPFETVRRRVARLRDRGRCEIGPDGVIVPQRSLETPAHAAVIMDNYRVLQRTFRRLEVLGFFDGQAWPATAWRPGDPPPLRASVRHSADYCLRIVDQLRVRTGDVLNGLILFQLVRETTAALGDSRDRFQQPNGPALAPDAVKTPVGASLIAERLRVDRETVRRRLVSLTAEGLVARRGAGYILPVESMMRLKTDELIEVNDANLRRLYRGLAKVGAIEAWRAEAESAAAA
ncbi:HTH domain-containing protein [Phenylobacterium kunshanense]|uniref:Uncharacterized protein n=1 Tax=Phenylobacterium kunshanense TaxID=1445034 RepID=A0A328B9W9_9CAUL|nr:HTH domain-containing protein [Phenylobacterium kunshanense]RAK63599.1 hypothetical protein DJ019_15155 [Phenylobacterium kunshanense]